MLRKGVSLECLFSIADGDEFSGCSAALSQSSSELDWITGLKMNFKKILKNATNNLVG